MGFREQHPTESIKDMKDYTLWYLTKSKG